MSNCMSLGMNSMMKLTVLMVTLTVINSKEVDKDKVKKATKYLQRYGYVSSFSDTVSSEKIKIFQEYADLKVTGELDDATLKKMEEPRCGMRDPALKIKTNGRVRRYYHQGSSWDPLFRSKNNKMELKWTLLNSGRSMSYGDVLKVMRKAFYLWNLRTNIDFIEVPKSKVGQKGFEKDNIEILVSFERGVHHDPYPFDGSGGTLAHAFYPHNNKGLSGDVHFDDDEYFTSKFSRSGKYLLWVAAHELGHSLGLAHSTYRQALMYPWYRHTADVKLHYDDTLGIQLLYGSRTKPKPLDPSNPTTTPTTKTTPTPTTTPTTTTIPTTTTTTTTRTYKAKCPAHGTIKAVEYNERYKVMMVYDSQEKAYLVGYRDAIEVGSRYAYYPKRIIPGSLDAILKYDKIGSRYKIIFSGNQYYVYQSFARRGGPHSIHNYNDGPLRLNFPSSVKHIDAAFTWFVTGRTYFFSGSQYWRYDSNRKRFDAGYPKPISENWGKLPNPVDAVYSAPNGQTYFIVKGIYYHFDVRNQRVKAVYSLNQFLQCTGTASR